MRGKLFYYLNEFLFLVLLLFILNFLVFLVKKDFFVFSLFRFNIKSVKAIFYVIDVKNYLKRVKIYFIFL
jgi:hypothetical protein